MNPVHSPEPAAGCPPWCNGEHESTDERRILHRSNGVIVPGVERLITPEGRLLFPSAVEVAIGLELRDDETWVWIGSDAPMHRSMVLSVESTRRLIREMEKILSGVL